MRLRPYNKHGVIGIMCELDASDEALIAVKEPSPMDWIGRLIWAVPGGDWECEACNVLSGCVLYIPRYKGWVQPVGQDLENSLDVLMENMLNHLQNAGITVVD